MVIELKQLLESILNKGKDMPKNGEMVYYCPFCHHHKLKFCVNIDKNSKKFQNWHCWVCGESGRNLYHLFAKLNVSSFYITKLKNLLSKYKISTDVEYTVQQINKPLVLPKEFEPLHIKKTNPEYRAALHFIKKRNISDLDIIKYDIGYCESGKYKNRIILPSYDKFGNLNYFTARDFYNRSDRKYLNPAYNKENSIIYENFINWNMPITLCEGMFDAISIKINAIPLLGKFITPRLKMMLIKYRPDIYIALDEDAYIDTIKSGLDLINEGLNIYIINLLKNQDPGSMGFEKMQTLMKNPKKYTESDILSEFIQMSI